MKTLSVLIPAFNERQTLVPILCRVLGVDLAPLGLTKEIVVVDDGSSDGTAEIVRRLGDDWRKVLIPALRERRIPIETAIRNVSFTVAFHERNQGKAGALRTAIERYRGDLAIIQDADLEYDPEDYPAMLLPILSGRADVVYGSRFLGTERRVHLYWHAVGNRLITAACNMASNLNLTDVETGYKAFRANVLSSLCLESERFAIEPELTIKLAKMRYRIYEVPVSYHGRSYEFGKKTGWRDGVEALWSIGRFLVSGQVVKESVLEETLEKMQGLRHFNQHIFEAIRPWLGDCIVEAGAGHGSITDHLLTCGRVIATDTEASALSRLRERYEDLHEVEVLPWDMTEAFPEISGSSPDTVVCLNVLEHIEDDALALVRTRELLEERGGRLVLLVPAHPSLYTKLDRLMSHHRRYERDDLESRIRNAGFELESLEWFNLLGMPGWWLNGKVLGRERLPTGQMWLYNWFSRFWLPLEGRARLPVGLSLLACARAPRRVSSQVPREAFAKGA